jgi:hypothetical protein
MKGALLLALALLLSGCGASALEPELFSVDFTNARYPVMLSRATSCRGRPIRGTSGVVAKRSAYGTEKRWNVMGASAQVAAQVQGNDTCVQIERVVFRATHAAIWAVEDKSEQELSIEGSVSP